LPHYFSDILIVSLTDTELFYNLRAGLLERGVAKYRNPENRVLRIVHLRPVRHL